MIATICLMFCLSPGCGGKQVQKVGLPAPELATLSPLRNFLFRDAERGKVRKAQDLLLGKHTF